MLTVAVFAFIVIIMICGGMLLARLSTAKESGGSWMWGCFILIGLICVPLFLLSLCVWFLFFGDISSGRFNPFG